MKMPELHTRNLTKKMTFKVVIGGARELKFRMYVGSVLIRLAARVIGCGIEITTVMK